MTTENPGMMPSAAVTEDAPIEFDGPPPSRDASGVQQVARQFARRPWLVALVVLVLVVVAPWSGASGTLIRLTELSAIYFLLVSGVNLTWGYAGELSLGHAVTFAVGAYLGGYFALHVTTDVLVGLAAACALGAAFGLVVGLPGLRISGLSFAMVTFFLVLLIGTGTAVLPNLTGGYTGLTGIPPATLFGSQMVGTSYYLLCIVVALLWLLFMRSFIKSEYGRTFSMLRNGPVLAGSVGISVYRQKVLSYVLGSVPAAAAGFLFAHLDGYVAPADFGFTLAAALIAASVIGGNRSIYGAIVGAALVQVGPVVTAGFTGYSLLIYGAILLFGAILTTGGVADLGRRAAARVFHGLGVTAPGEGAPAGWKVPRDASLEDDLEGGGEVVAVNEVSMQFGGAKALDAVSLRIEPGAVTALVGANGSGKTTLLNILSGFYKPTGGEVSIGDERLDGRAAHRVRGAGVCRTFQTPNVPDDLATIDAVAGGAWAEDPSDLFSSVFATPWARRRERHHRALAWRALRRLRMEQHAWTNAAALPLGQRRLVEVARAAVGNPRLMLLDEPASGLSPGECDRLTASLRTFEGSKTAVLLVEHNMDFVMATADHVYVLDSGRVIANGTPDEVMNNAVVLDSYLGREVG